MDKEYCIVANVVSDRLLRQGAKAYIVGATGGAFPQTQVYGMARWGKKIIKYINMARLENFRAAWNPYTDLIWAQSVYSKEQAERIAKYFNFYFHSRRAYSPNGSVLIKSGLPDSQIQPGFDFKIRCLVDSENLEAKRVFIHPQDFR